MISLVIVDFEQIFYLPDVMSKKLFLKDFDNREKKLFRKRMIYDDFLLKKNIQSNTRFSSVI